MIGLLVLGFLFFSGNSLFAQSDFESCLEIERLKAKNEGASFSESREHAKDFCNLQFEEKKKLYLLKNNLDFLLVFHLIFQERKNILVIVINLKLL